MAATTHHKGAIAQFSQAHLCTIIRTLHAHMEDMEECATGLGKQAPNSLHHKLALRMLKERKAALSAALTQWRYITGNHFTGL